MRGGEGRVPQCSPRSACRLFRDYVEVDNVSVALAAQARVDATTRFLADQVLATYLAAAPSPTPSASSATGRRSPRSRCSTRSTRPRDSTCTSFATDATAPSRAGPISSARTAPDSSPRSPSTRTCTPAHSGPAPSAAARRIIRSLPRVALRGSSRSGHRAVCWSSSRSTPARPPSTAAGSFERLSGGRRRGKEVAGSHFRKGVVGDWREHFDEGGDRRFEAAAGPLRKDLGIRSRAVTGVLAARPRSRCRIRLDQRRDRE